jgi:hypothetical protein
MRGQSRRIGLQTSQYAPDLRVPDLNAIQLSRNEPDGRISSATRVGQVVALAVHLVQFALMHNMIRLQQPNWQRQTCLGHDHLRRAATGERLIYLPPAGADQGSQAAPSCGELAARGTATGLLWISASLSPHPFVGTPRRHFIVTRRALSAQTDCGTRPYVRVACDDYRQGFV